MKNKFAALQYKTTDKIDVASENNAQSILIKCYDELLKSIQSFQDNIVPNTLLVLPIFKFTLIFCLVLILFLIMCFFIKNNC